MTAKAEGRGEEEHGTAHHHRRLAQHGDIRLLSAIAILGLAVGIAAALLMALEMHNQFTFDHFMPDHARTYVAISRANPALVNREPCRGAGTRLCLGSDAKLAPQLQLSAPEVEAVTRLVYSADLGTDRPVKLQHGDVTEPCPYRLRDPHERALRS
jgi:hypothetical protein